MVPKLSGLCVVSKIKGVRERSVGIRSLLRTISFGFSDFVENTVISFNFYIISHVCVSACEAISRVEIHR